jgi:hypothetical protein
MVMEKVHTVAWTPVYADIVVRILFFYTLHELIGAFGRKRKEFVLPSAPFHFVSIILFYQEISESDWLWDEKNRERQGERSRRYKNFLKKVLNKTEGQEFYVSSPEEDPKPPGKKDSKRIAGIRVAEYLDYGITNPTEENLREMFANEERARKVIHFLIPSFLQYLVYFLPVLFDSRHNV